MDSSLLLSCLLILVVGGLGYLIYKNTGDIHAKDLFDAAEWRESALPSKRVNRVGMMQDLTKNHLKKGMPETKLVEMLGPPEGRRMILLQDDLREIQQQHGVSQADMKGHLMQKFPDTFFVIRSTPDPKGHYYRRLFYSAGMKSMGGGLKKCYLHVFMDKELKLERHDYGCGR